MYYQNGNLKLKGKFINGNPAGKWTFYLEDGAPDLEVNFNFDEFVLNVINKKNPNFSINSGTGKFSILLDKWNKAEFILEGELLNNNREGQWAYYQNNEKIISEKYKKGKFRSGYVKTNFGNISRTNSYIDASIFIPPQLTQVAGLYFTTVEAGNYYSFIKKMGL
ncbi:hypothetical protein OU798_20595 [Prolixibacteraceae bacterium Z1-6]|uniref:Uncharacterized protein n=1 Tax=Draconibacterium aestuarii TaxID=2998507 RepID=A0A9X3J8N9_9BACT|nr:hypothetical protein [Prolixibacteraceae bacterium Z1-6]